MTVERFLKLGGEPPTEDIGAILDEVGAGTVRAANSSASYPAASCSASCSRARSFAIPISWCSTSRCSGVDYTGEAELYNLIGRLRDERGFGVLLVSHDLHIVMARATASSVSTVTSAARACPRRWRSTQPTRACSDRRRRARSRVYRHHHDHSHDIAGVAHSAGEPAASERRSAAGDERA